MAESAFKYAGIILTVCAPLFTAGVLALATFLWDTNSTLAVLADRQDRINQELSMMTSSLDDFMTKSSANQAFSRINAAEKKQSDQISKINAHFQQLDSRVQRLEDLGGAVRSPR